MTDTRWTTCAHCGTALALCEQALSCCTPCTRDAAAHSPSWPRLSARPVPSVPEETDHA